MGGSAGNDQMEEHRPLRLAVDAFLLRLHLALLGLGAGLRHVHDVLPLEPRRGGVLGTLQVLIGRLLGRLVLLWHDVRESWRVRRSRISKGSVSPLGILLSILRQQLGRIVWLLAVFALALLADWVLQSYQLDWLPAVEWLRETLSLPSDGTLTDLLFGVSAGTGVILGLVLTVSMTVFQTTAERYDSDRVVQFLLREPVGSLVISLLSTGFILSLLTLGVMGVFSFSPVIATYVTLLISILGVLAAIVYRQYALFGYLPRSLFSALARETRRVIRRIHRHPGKTVEFLAHKIAREDLLTCEELLRYSLTRQNLDAVASGLSGLTDIVRTNMAVKTSIPERSPWWEWRMAPLAGLGFGLGDHLARSSGLTTPVQQLPHAEWVEELALGMSDSVISSNACLASPGTLDALHMYYAVLAASAWGAQDTVVLDLLFSQLETFACAEPDTVTDVVGKLALQLVDVISQPPSPSPRSVVAARPWTKKGHLSMPFLIRGEAEVLRKQIRREQSFAGAVLTPEDQMVRELESRWTPVWQDLTGKYLARTFGLLTARLEALAGGDADAMSAAAEAWFGLLLVALGKQLHPTIGAEVGHVLKTYGSDTPERRDKLWRLLLLSIHAAAQGRDQRIVSSLLVVLVSWYQFELDKRLPDGLVARMNDLLITLVIAHGWAEFYGDDYLLKQLVAIVSPAFVDVVIQYADGSFKSMPGRLRFAGMTYIQWLQPLDEKARKLPDEVGFGLYATQKQHKSKLFRGWSITHGAEHWIEGFVWDLGACVYVPRLIDALTAAAAQRSSS